MKDLAEKRLALGRYGRGATEEVSDVEVCFEGSVGADGMRPREMATAHVDKDDAFEMFGQIGDYSRYLESIIPNDQTSLGALS